MIIPKEVKEKPIEYIFLGLVFVLGFFLYLFLDNSKTRMWIICSVAILYFCWSLVHHYKRKDLQISIIVEYLLVILLGIIFISETLF